MVGSRLPAIVAPHGPHNDLGQRVYHLMICGRSTEALALADEYERLARGLSDDRTVAMIMQARMYALVRLERFAEALATGDELLGAQRGAGLRANEAKALADTAEILIRLGRLDEGLYRLAAATVLLDAVPRTSIRYAPALSSVCGAARSAQLYELAEEAAAKSLRANPAGAVEISPQRAELLLDWALGLEQAGRVEDAARYYARSVAQTEQWLAGHAEDADRAPLLTVTRAIGLAKLGRHTEAEALVCDLIVPMRFAGHDQEARRAHLAYGLALRGRGEFAAARREFIAALELADDAWQRLSLQYELANLTAAERVDPAAHAILTVLRAQAQYLWRLRQERRMMLQQARQRIELEVARAAADRAVARDALTGLGNRRQFDRQIANADESYVLVLIDVDNFKTINDSYSHSTGDRILCEVAATLRAHCRAEDCAVRLGGDEFAMFLRTDPDRAAAVAERIRGVLAERDWTPFGAGLSVTLSMGIAPCVRDVDPSVLYDRADRQLYEAKRRGRNQVSVRAA
jgi:diguanylate cyclase